MKAVRVREFGDPDVMGWEDAPDPAPGTDEVLVEVKAAGVNPLDVYIRAGMYPQIKVDFPYTPGMDAAGVVEAVGEEVQGFKAGDRVYTAGSLSGVYAEKTLCHVSEVHPLPETVSFEQGAAVGIPYATAYHALFNKAWAQHSDRVLIHGASGGGGVAAVQLAKNAGLQVIGTAGTEEGAALVGEQGADHVLNHLDDGHFKEIMGLTEGRGVDIILEMLADKNLDEDLEVLALRGRVVVIGCRGEATINPREIMGREAAVVGMVIMNASDEEKRMIHLALGKGLSDGSLRPVIGAKYPMSESAAAHEAVMNPGAHGKIVLLPRS